MIIHKDELWDAADTIVWVFDAVVYRHNDLEGMITIQCPIVSVFNNLLLVFSALFKQQRLDPVQQFKAYASELVCVPSIGSVS